MERERLEVGAVLRLAWSAVLASPAAVFGYIVAIATLGSLTDYFLAESRGGLLLVTIADFVAGFFLTIVLLRAVGLRHEGQGGGLGSYFAVGFLGGLGTLLGLLLLIIPGLILLVRWWPATVIVLCDDIGASDALSESWELTKGQFWPILAVMLIGMIPFALLAFGVGYAVTQTESLQEESSTLVVVGINIVSSLYSVYSVVAGIAVYWSLRGDRSKVSDVFA